MSLTLHRCFAASVSVTTPKCSIRQVKRSLHILGGMRLITLLVCCCFQVTRSQNVDISNGGDLAAQMYQANPFLSATLSTTITYNPEAASLQSSSPFHLDFDLTRKLTFSKTLTKFLTKIFTDQQAYDLRILSVNIFDDHVLHRKI